VLEKTWPWASHSWVETEAESGKEKENQRQKKNQNRLSHKRKGARPTLTPLRLEPERLLPGTHIRPGLKDEDHTNHPTGGRRGRKSNVKNRENFTLFMQGRLVQDSSSRPHRLKSEKASRTELYKPHFQKWKGQLQRLLSRKSSRHVYWCSKKSTYRQLTKKISRCCPP